MSETSHRTERRSDSGSSLLGALFRNLMSLFFVGVSVMCVYNVFGVGAEVEALAKETACQGQPLPCTAQYTRGERTPWAHTYKMYTSPTSGDKDIVCKREYILVGDYACKALGGTITEPVAEPASSAKVGGASSTPARFPTKTKTPIPRPQPTGSSVLLIPHVPGGAPTGSQ